MKIAAVADIHIRKTDHGKWKEFFTFVSSQSDVLLICGDLTDTGHQTEAEILKQELEHCSIPIIAVLGNHDFEQDMENEILEILRGDQIHVLDGESVVINNIGFAGTKGFSGGFTRYMLPRFGEKINKLYVQEAVEESLKLDQALVRLEGKGIEKKVVLLHYSPILDTIIGEPPEIYSFLGSSRLEWPINNRQVNVVFHGHAHLGKLKGASSQGVQVLNVSKHILEKEGHTPPVYFMEL
jgi:Icc-related predicted phosphoesterase